MKGIRISRGSSGVIDASKMRARAGVVEPSSGVVFTLVIPLRTVSRANSNEHHFARHKRVRAEREAVAAALVAEWGSEGRQFVRAWVDVYHRPLTVTLTRIGGRGLDRTVNLPSSLKAVEDEMAAWCGVDDASPLWRCTCWQEPGPLFGVRVAVVAGRGA